MAKVQRYQGRGKATGKYYYRIQPYLPNGHRVTIRFGTGKKQAERGATAIMDLIDSKKAGVEPSAVTKQWIETIADEVSCLMLLDYQLIDSLPKKFQAQDALGMTVSELADEFVRVRGVGKQNSTLAIYDKAKGNLIECFGDLAIEEFRVKHGREFWRWLMEEKQYSENTAKQRLRYARAFFEMAVEDELLSKNPMRARGLTVNQSSASKDYVPWQMIETTIASTECVEWKLLFALARSIPLRIRSEIDEFTWDDVDWKENRMLIHSPKTRKLGKAARMVPILPSFEPYLRQACEQRDPEESYVFAGLRKMSSIGMPAKRIVERAGLTPWSNFFNALRASAETDLMDQYGLRRACMWAGNSPATAMKNYALVRKTDFQDLGMAGPKGDAKSDAMGVLVAKSDAAPASTVEQGGSKNPQKNALPSHLGESNASLVGGIGLEPTTSTMSTWRSSQLS